MGTKRHREKKSKSEAEPANKSVKVEQPPAHIKEVDVGPQKEIAKHIKKQEKRLIVVLESANLETVKVTIFNHKHSKDFHSKFDRFNPFIFMKSHNWFALFVKVSKWNEVYEI